MAPSLRLFTKTGPLGPEIGWRRWLRESGEFRLCGIGPNLPAAAQDLQALPGVRWRSERDYWLIPSPVHAHMASAFAPPDPGAKSLFQDLFGVAPPPPIGPRMVLRDQGHSVDAALLGTGEAIGVDPAEHGWILDDGLALWLPRTAGDIGRLARTLGGSLKRLLDPADIARLTSSELYLNAPIERPPNVYRPGVKIGSRRPKKPDGLPFGAMRAVEVSDLLTIMEGTGQGGGPRAPGKIEGMTIFSYDEEQEVFTGLDPLLSRRLGFEFRGGRYCTSNHRLLLEHRHLVDDEAEMAIQERMTAEWTLDRPPVGTFNPIPVPPGEALSAHQVVGVEFIASRRHTLVADEMGVGKTAEALAAINATHPVRTLVVCPASLKGNWLVEARKWLVVNQAAVLTGDRLPPHPLDPTNPATVVICGYEQVIQSKCLHGLAWDLVIFDEAHQLKNPDSQRTRAALGTGESRGLKGAMATAAGGSLVPLLVRSATKGVRIGARRNQTADQIQVHAVPGWNTDLSDEQLGRKMVDGLAGRRMVFMTGTPILNRPQDLWPMLRTIAPEIFCDQKRFMRLYKVDDVKNVPPELQVRLDRLGGMLRRGLMIRRLKREVLPDLPEKTRQVITVPLPESIAADLVAREQRIIEQREVLVGTPGGRLVQYQEVLSELQRLRKEIGLVKLPFIQAALLEHLAEHGDEHPLLLFSHHKEIARALAETAREAGFPFEMMTGDESPTKRHAACQRFQAGKGCGVSATLDAAGVGYTLTRSHDVWFSELDWQPPKILQAEDRAHRNGQRWPVRCRYFVVDGTIDSRLAITFASKADIASITLNDGAGWWKVEASQNTAEIDQAATA